MLKNARISWLLWTVLSACAWFHMIAGLEGMPPHLATHFGAGGRPDGWMSPTTFILFEVGMWSVMTVSFWGPRGLLRVVSPRWINLPHREYWLAPERRDEALPRMAAWIEGYGLVTLLALVGVNELVFAANRLAEPQLTGNLWIGLVVYLGGTVVWIVALLRSFRLPEGVSAR